MQSHHLNHCHHLSYDVHHYHHYQESYIALTILRAELTLSMPVCLLSLLDPSSIMSSENDGSFFHDPLSIMVDSISTMPSQPCRSNFRDVLPDSETVT